MVYELYHHTWSGSKEVSENTVALNCSQTT